MSVEKSAKLEKIRSIAEGCFNCSLGSIRKKLVFGEGNIDTKILFVGESPGREEDESGRPFVGRCGQLLRKMIIAIDLDPEKDCYIGNVCKCRPPSNRPPEPEEISECIKFLQKQVEIISPKLIILLGRTAVKGLLPEHAKTPLDFLRKESKTWVYSYGGAKILVSYHPSALLRDPSRRIGAAEDFRFIESWIKEN